MISFLINAYEGDWPHALKLLRQVRRVYPRSVIALLCDGFFNKKMAFACRELNAIPHIGHRVKTEISHAWSDRLFSVASTLPGYIVKIDADMWINRPLELPDSNWDICCDNYAGSPVIGGCIAFSSAVIPRLQAFLEHCPVETYKELTELQYCQDKMLRRAINKLNLNVLPLPDAKINWLDPVEDPRQHTVFGPRVEAIQLTGQRCKLITFRKSK